MTNQEQQKNEQPHIVKKMEYAFAPSPRTAEREQEAKEKPEITETIPTPEKDIDDVN